MDDAPFTIKPRHVARTVGECIWCGKSPPEVELRDEHVIPASFGGHWVIEDGCCRGCEKDQSAYIGKCCNMMFASLRFHHGLPVSKKKKLSERTIKILVSNTETVAVPQDEAPGVIFLPVLELPRLLSGEPAKDNEFLMLGAYVKSTTDDATARQKALEAAGHARALSYSQMPVTEFTRVLAHIGHAYYMSSAKPVREDSLLLPIAQGDLRSASRYLGGWPLQNPPILDEPGKGGLHQIYAANVRAGGVDYVGARIRLFSYLRPSAPTYIVLLARRPIPEGDQYFSFTREQRPDGVHVEVSLAVA